MSDTIEIEPDGTEFYCGLCGVIGEPLAREREFRYRCSECVRFTKFFPLPERLADVDGATVEERQQNAEKQPRLIRR